MKTKTHPLNEIWESHPDILVNTAQVTTPLKIEELLAQIFTSGPFYYYTLNVTNSRISHYNNDILHLHGLKKLPNHLKDIIDLIHPDDIEFVRAAENWTLIKMKEIGYEHQMSLKMGYCFRMKVNDGSYQLFHHQAIHTLKNDKGQLVQAFNIHTNINHISQHNNYIATLTHINHQKNFYQFHFQNEHPPQTIERLSKRELEILVLLSKGYSNQSISELINISYHTVRTHRKNILKKTYTKNGSELVKKCVEMGYL